MERFGVTLERIKGEGLSERYREIKIKRGLFYFPDNNKELFLIQLERQRHIIICRREI